MNPVETYFRDLSEIRSTGANVPETSFYGALEKLLNEIGKTLKPSSSSTRNFGKIWESGSHLPK
jgi:hypothetical protein